MNTNPGSLIICSFNGTAFSHRKLRVAYSTNVTMLLGSPVLPLHSLPVGLPVYGPLASPRLASALPLPAPLGSSRRRRDLPWAAPSVPGRAGMCC